MARPPDHVTDLASKLERSILAGELLPGEKLPSERILSTRWGVSRSVVREALGRLMSLGLVQSKHGSGTSVAQPSTKQLEVGLQRLLARPDYHLHHLAEMRLPLETTIASLAAERRSDAHLARLADTQTILGDAELTLLEHVEADLLFHAVLAEATGNPLFALVLEPIQKLLIESRRRTLDAFGADLAFSHHGRILAAVEACDAAAAREAMRLHLEANYQHLQKIEA